MTAHRDLSSFRKDGYDKGRGILWQALWFATMNLFFSPWWVPSRLRVAVLRWFGARVGDHVLIRHRVRVLWPWKLSVGANCWIGEGAWLLNLEPITLGDNVCISQEAMLCTGGHDPRAADFAYANAPIRCEDGAWIGARALVLAGVTIGQGGTVGAGAIAACPVPTGAVIVSHSSPVVPGTQPAGRPR
jgi:putative colanic acid biosynthesis acetyltransferase WcaF